MGTTYYFSTKNISRIEFNRLIVSWVIKIRVVIIQNAMSMMQSVIRLRKYGEINRVLMRSFNLNTEGENKFMQKNEC